ncbi:MAG: tetratricopeptide repeat protein [Deltaproteobacteria bacterium]|nr:tetratricopeptide repeat protein [Deltaproteobacteria bacterium]
MALKEKILDRAQKYIQKGSLDKAIAEYRAAADVDPRDISVRLRIGDLFVKTGRKAEAIKEYTEVAKANSQRGFYLKAIAVYKQVLKLEESIEIRNKLAELYVRQRLIADAISEYNHIMSSFEKRGKTAEVMELLKKMAEIDPENIGVRLKLADLYLKLSFEKDAFNEYSWIVDKLVSQGKFDKAEKICLTLYPSRPKEVSVLKGLAELYKKKGDNLQALKYLKTLFSLYIDAGDKEAARSACESILEVRPGDAGSLNFLNSLSSQKVPPEWTTEEKPLLEFPELPKLAGEEETPGHKKEPLVPTPEEEEIEITLEGFESEPAKEAAKEAPRQEAVPEIKAFTPPVEESSGEIEIEIEEEMAQEAAPQVEEEPAPEAVGSKGEEGIKFEIEEALNPEVKESEAQESKEEIAQIPEEKGLEIEDRGPVEEVLRSETETEAVPSGQTAEVEARIEAKEETFIKEEIKEEPIIAPPPELRELQGAGEPIEDAALKAASTTGIEEKEIEELVARTEAEAFEVVLQEVEKGLAEGEPVVGEMITEGPLPSSIEAKEAVKVAQERMPEVSAAPEAIIERSPQSQEEKESQEEISSAISELMEKIEPDDALLGPEKIKVEEPPAQEKEDEYVDLSAELGMKEALDDMAGSSWAGAESKDAFDEFKNGIGKQLSREDSETHYNLAIAYMEMELYNEASKEFKIALKDPRLEFDCYIRLGLCAMSQSSPEEAIVYYLKGLKVEGRPEEERKGIMYELALAYEAAGERDEAMQLFKTIYEIDPEFRDAAKKINAVRRDAPRIPLDDGLIEVELL